MVIIKKDPDFAGVAEKQLLYHPNPVYCNKQVISVTYLYIMH